jgi:hypothetical protein
MSIESILKRMEAMEAELKELRIENSTLKAAQSDSTQTGGSEASRGTNNKAQRTATSLISGMPVLHGIGSADISAEENVTFNKWYRQTEKSLTGSRVKIFNGVGWITWKQMILRDIILNQLKDVLLNEMTLEDVQELAPYDRKVYVTSDILLCGFIETKLNDRATNKVAACPTAYLKWQKLEETYAKSSVAAQNILTEQWNSLKQQPNQTIELFVEKIDYTAMEMAAAGIPPTDQSKLYTLLAGAGREYTTEIKILRRTHADYAESCVTLLEAGIEAGLSRQDKPEKAFAGKAYGGSARQGGSSAHAGAAGLPFLCFGCGSKDHETKACTNAPPQLRERGMYVARCFNCLADGHTSKECSRERRGWGTFKRVQGVPSDQGTSDGPTGQA